MTCKDIEVRLVAAGIEAAATEAKRLFSHFSGLSLAALLADRNADCADPALEAAVCRREAREPLAYIVGEAWFYGERYRVSPACLVPRQETELLVEYAINHLPEGTLFADFCTGSGCIAISVLAHRPDLRAHAYDISPDALALARENAAANGVADRVEFFCADLLKKGGVCRERRYDMIISNPPYLTAQDMRTAQAELAYEPSLALAGGEDGLTFYRYFLENYRENLACGAPFLFEIGAAQGEDLLALGEAHGFAVEILPDYAGLDRVAVLKPTNQGLPLEGKPKGSPHALFCIV